MFVKLSKELKERFDQKFITWTELKKKLKENLIDLLDDSELIGLLKGSQFLAKLPELKGEKIVSSEEYARLIPVTSVHSNIRTEIVHLRSDLIELRRESAWLLNCFFSVIGVATFVYFIVSFYFDRIETRMVCSLLSGVILFFLEVILYIIRS